jgi:hypothetical protein
MVGKYRNESKYHTNGREIQEQSKHHTNGGEIQEEK